MQASLGHRFWSKVDKTSGCWLWTAATTRNGYARYQIDGRSRVAHAVAWEAANGLVPVDMVLDHLCHTNACTAGDDCHHRRCVRPDHLAPVSLRDNILRGVSFSAVNAVKTHCAQGHPFDAANTYVSPLGKRGCRICREAAKQRYLARKAHE